ncbi:unnamed protein product [Cutaneotrichosporon oleaginosum]
MSPLPLPPANATLISLPSAQDISSPEFWTPNATQRATLIVMGVYVVAIGICTSLPRSLTPVLEPNEGGCTRMRGGVQFIVLPAGYLGSSFIGAALIACGFDINASKVACLVMAAFFVITLYWARRSWVAYATFMFTAVLIVVAWLVHHSVALRFFVLFLGVMSCLYCIWDIIDDTLKRKIASSDASQFAKVVGFGNSYVWGAFWLIISILFFGAGIAVGLAVFKSSWEDQMAAAERFLGGTPW